MRFMPHLYFPPFSFPFSQFYGRTHTTPSSSLATALPPRSSGGLDCASSWASFEQLCTPETTATNSPYKAAEAHCSCTNLAHSSTLETAAPSTHNKPAEVRLASSIFFRKINLRVPHTCAQIWKQGSRGRTTGPTVNGFPIVPVDARLNYTTRVYYCNSKYVNPPSGEAGDSRYANTREYCSSTIMAWYTQLHQHTFRNPPDYRGHLIHAQRKSSVALEWKHKSVENLFSGQPTTPSRHSLGILQNRLPWSAHLPPLHLAGGCFFSTALDLPGTASVKQRSGVRSSGKTATKKPQLQLPRYSVWSEMVYTWHPW
jgi:hypothetical protein